MIESQLAVTEAEHLMQFFECDYLSADMTALTRQFFDVAEFMTVNLPRNPERTAGLRKLLEARDCAIRALVMSK